MPNGVLRSQNQKIFGASRLRFQSTDHQNLYKGASLVHATKLSHYKENFICIRIKSTTLIIT